MECWLNNKPDHRTIQHAASPWSSSSGSESNREEHPVSQVHYPDAECIQTSTAAPAKAAAKSIMRIFNSKNVAKIINNHFNWQFSVRARPSKAIQHNSTMGGGGDGGWWCTAPRAPRVKLHLAHLCQYPRPGHVALGQSCSFYLLSTSFPRHSRSPATIPRANNLTVWGCHLIQYTVDCWKPWWWVWKIVLKTFNDLSALTYATTTPPCGVCKQTVLVENETDPSATFLCVKNEHFLLKCFDESLRHVTIWASRLNAAAARSWRWLLQ